MHAWKPALVAGAAGAVVTLAVVVVPTLAFAYARPDLHLVLETAEALIGVSVVYLLVGRLQQRRQGSDEWLLFALVLLAGTNIAAAVQGAVLSEAVQDDAAWGQVSGRLVGAVAIAWASFAPHRLIPRAPTAVARALLGALGVIVAVLVIGQWWAPHLPPLLTEFVDPQPATRPLLVGHPMLLGAQAASAVLFLLAAWGFGRRAATDEDELMRWIAAGMVLSALARVNYLLFPSLYSGYVYTGDVLRLVSYLLLLVGASREVRGYWRLQAEAAAAEERRRLARDLHDGLAQELNFLTMQARQLSNRPQLSTAHVELERISSAGQRALEEARRAIDFLVHTRTEPLEELLTRTVEDVAARHGVVTSVTVEPEPAFTPAEIEQVTRIVREAVTNACVHGGAGRIQVEVSWRDDEAVLRICDDGSGFDAAAPRGRASFGLTSMRERAGGLGGALDVTTQPGAGTTITVRIPAAASPQ
jgi:signal transduction histidine kinase